MVILVLANGEINLLSNKTAGICHVLLTSHAFIHGYQSLNGILSSSAGRFVTYKMLRGNEIKSTRNSR